MGKILGIFVLQGQVKKIKFISCANVSVAWYKTWTGLDCWTDWTIFFFMQDCRLTFISYLFILVESVSSVDICLFLVVDYGVLTL